MASRDKVFLDADVVLDHLADRQPFSDYSHRLFAMAETGELTLCVSALSFANLYYMLRKPMGHDAALAALDRLRRLVTVAKIGEPEISGALASRFRDFEDAIQHFAAKAEGGVSTILTRNGRDFSASELPVMAPDDYLALRMK